MKEFIEKHSAYLAWGIALAAMIGSLYFSEVKGFTPCVLCWYQRIALYPLVFLIPVGILRKDNGLSSYVLPVATIGFLVSVYQNLLYYGIIPENFSPCTVGVSCLTKYVEYFGFLTIPLLSLLSLAAIIVLMVIHKKSNHA